MQSSAELGSNPKRFRYIYKSIANSASVHLPNCLLGKTPRYGVVYVDPKRDPMVSRFYGNKARRRVELIMQEGFRNDDLRRWGKLEYTDTKSNPDINRGAWLRKSDYPASMTAEIENNANEGYIIPAPALETMRVFDNPRVYLYPVPLDQITLYKDNGVILTQNPGWQ